MGGSSTKSDSKWPNSPSLGEIYTGEIYQVTSGPKISPNSAPTPEVWAAFQANREKPPPEPKTRWQKFKDEPWCSHLVGAAVGIFLVGALVVIALLATDIIRSSKSVPSVSVVLDEQVVPRAFVMPNTPVSVADEEVTVSTVGFPSTMMPVPSGSVTIVGTIHVPRSKISRIRTGTSVVSSVLASKTTPVSSRMTRSFMTLSLPRPSQTRRV